MFDKPTQGARRGLQRGGLFLARILQDISLHTTIRSVTHSCWRSTLERPAFSSMRTVLLCGVGDSGIEWDEALQSANEAGKDSYKLPEMCGISSGTAGMPAPLSGAGLSFFWAARPGLWIADLARR